MLFGVWITKLAIRYHHVLIEQVWTVYIPRTKCERTSALLTYSINEVHVVQYSASAGFDLGRSGIVLECFSRPATRMWRHPSG